MKLNLKKKGEQGTVRKDAEMVSPQSEAPANITGAKSGNLESESAAALSALRGKKAVDQKSKVPTAAELEAQRMREAAMLDLCKEIVKGEFTIPVLVTGDERYLSFLAKERLDALAVRWQVFFLAYGMEFTGKVTSVIALSIAHLTTAGEIVRMIAAEDAQLPPEAVKDAN